MVGPDLNLLLEANRLLLADLEKRAAQVDEREARARGLLIDCEAERRQIDAERDALHTTERLYRRRFLPADPDEFPASSLGSEYTAPIEAGDGRGALSKPRARIGPQRYRIFVRLKSWSRPAEIDEIAKATGLSAKRVRDQMRADVPDGFMKEASGKYELTPSGWDLLDRFENYKRSRGEPLPPLEGPVREDDFDSSRDDLLEELAG